MATNTCYDIIVIGAGIEGSWTSYHLARNKKRVLLLEQFCIPHTRGSSHGQSRIIRKAYSQSYYSHMMREAYPLWFDLERDTGTSLYKKTGMLVLGKPGSECMKKMENSLISSDSNYQKLSPSQLQSQFPMIQYEGWGALLDHEAGILRAEKALLAVHQAFKQCGGVLQDGEPVTDIYPGTEVAVKTARCIYKAKRIVITAGPWTSKLLQPLGLNLPLQILGIHVLYWKQAGSQYSLRTGFPTFIEKTTGNCYGLPAEEYPNHVKICLHHGDVIDPDRRDVARATWDIEMMQRYIRTHFPGLEDRPSIIEKCIYTNTPDEDFVLDTDPSWSNIVIGAGFSGHGFKLAPVVGRVLSDLALGRTPSYDMKPFRIARFTTGSTQSKL